MAKSTVELTAEGKSQQAFLDEIKLDENNAHADIIKDIDELILEIDTKGEVEADRYSAAIKNFNDFFDIRLPQNFAIDYVHIQILLDLVEAELSRLSKTDSEPTLDQVGGLEGQG